MERKVSRKQVKTLVNILTDEELWKGKYLTKKRKYLKKCADQANIDAIPYSSEYKKLVKKKIIIPATLTAAIAGLGCYAFEQVTNTPSTALTHIVEGLVIVGSSFGIRTWLHNRVFEGGNHDKLSLFYNCVTRDLTTHSAKIVETEFEKVNVDYISPNITYQTKEDLSPV